MIITDTLPFRMVGVEGGEPLVAEMKYDTSAPLELTFTFYAGRDHEVSWVVSRDLIHEGVNSEKTQGFGDIQIRRDSHSHVTVTLYESVRNEHGEVRRSGTAAYIRVSRAKLLSFVRRTYILVKAGEEFDKIDWDGFDNERVTW